MAPRLPFPPLSAAGGATGGGSSVLHCSSERIAAVLIIATFVWFAGLIAFLGTGSHGGTLEHPTGPHSHREELRPRGYIAPAAPIDPRNGVDAAPQGHSRGFGLAKLVGLERDLRTELHNLFQHDAHYEAPTSRHGHKHAEEADGHGEDAAAAGGASKGADNANPSPSGPVVIPGPTTTTSPGLGMSNPAVAVLTYKRRNYLLRTLDSLVACPGLKGFELYVSQDGDVPDLGDLPSLYSSTGLTLFRHPRLALLSADQSATAYLAQHYKWVLDKLFLERGHSHVVVLEDDMLVSPDFLSLFAETAPLLDSDPTLLCVSSWNDNGMNNLVADNRRLMRTDYFPGLGWMTNRRVWAELSPVFPLDQWDHFMRLDTTHRGRDCLIPEVARNRNIGEHGTNMGDNFFSKYLAPIAFNRDPVSFLLPVPSGAAGADAAAPLTPGLEHLRSANYERLMHDRVRSAVLLGNIASPMVQSQLHEALRVPAQAPRIPGSLTPVPGEEEWLVVYNRRDYHVVAKMFGLISTPRSVHKGISTLRLGSHLVYFADVRTCPYLPTALQFVRDPSMKAVAAQQNEPCTQACARQREDVDGSAVERVCSADHFQFINECSQLLKAFPCIKGCRGGVAGLDVPNYVDNPQKAELFGLCLTTEEDPTCEARHWSASRLCPCVIKKN